MRKSEKNIFKYKLKLMEDQMIEIKDFKKVANVPQEIINKYENILSEEIIEFWKDYGLGTFF